MEQLTLDQAIAGRDDGIRRAGDHAGEIWRRGARGYVLEYIATIAGPFLAEDVRAFAEARHFAPPPDARALGRCVPERRPRGADPEGRVRAREVLEPLAQGAMERDMTAATVTPIAAHPCAQKKRYATEAAAHSELFSMRARGSEIVERLEAKPCTTCHGWHLKRKPMPMLRLYNSPPTNPDAPRRGRRPSLPYKDDD